MLIWNMFRVKDGKLTDHWTPRRLLDPPTLRYGRQ